MSWLAHDQYPAALAQLAALRANGSAFCWTFKLAHPTQEGREIPGLRIHGSARREGESRGVLVVAGAHAREMVPPEAALCFAVLLCNAYKNGTGLSFGGKSYPNGIVKLLVEVLEIYLVPLLNVDGRIWVETNDQNWRKNRRPGACRGVDLNRNHDFLFTSGIGTSNNPCDYQIYRGPNAHSEPEARGIRDFLNAKPHIKGVLDVHSYSGLVLYPWGDDQNQTVDTSKNFLNSTWDGLRGIMGDSYREYIASNDLAFYSATAARIRDRIQQVAGRTYVAQPSFDLYGTSGTLEDYGYARHLASSSAAKAMSMTVEIGFSGDGGFRPPEPAAQTIRMEGAVAILEFCLAIMCAGDALLNGQVTRSSAAALREFRKKLADYGGGQHHLQALEMHSGELIARFANPRIARAAGRLVDLAIEWSRGEREIDSGVVQAGNQLIGALAKGASRELRAALSLARADLARIAGQPVEIALGMLSSRHAKRRRASKARRKRS
jgi:hypothetical protein